MAALRVAAGVLDEYVSGCTLGAECAPPDTAPLGMRDDVSAVARWRDQRTRGSQP